MKNEWLIIFVIYADFFGADIEAEEKLTRELQNVYTDLISTRFDSSCAVYCIVNNIRALKDSNNQRVDKTIVQRVKRGNGEECNLIEEVKVLDFKNGVQRDTILSTALKVVESFENSSKQVALFTWDHGSVFGINKEGEQSKVKKLSSVNYEELVTCRGNRRNKVSDTAVFFKYDNTIFQIDSNNLKRFEEVLKNQDLYTINLSNGTIDFSAIDKFTISIKAQKPDFSWGHTFSKDANGFNNFSFEINDGNRKAFMASISRILHVINDPHPSFKITSEVKTEMLTNKELASAIGTGLKKGKADLLLMMNCNMMNVHVMGALKGKVDFLVAPESGIDEPGYNYCAILSSIKENLAPISLADTCVSSFRTSPGCGSNECNEYRKEYFAKEKESVSLFAVDLRPVFVDSILGLINGFGKKMEDKMRDKTKDEYKLMKSGMSQIVRNEKITLQTDKKSRLFLYDMVEWLDIMESTIASHLAFSRLNELIKGDLIEFRSKLMAQKNDMIISENQNGKKVFSSLGIFLPYDNVKGKGTDLSIQFTESGEVPDDVSGWLSFLVHFLN